MPIMTLRARRLVAEPTLGPTRPWCAFGVRDPVLVTKPSGRPAIGPLGFELLFSGRDRAPAEGGVTVVGRAFSYDLIHWLVQPEPCFTDGTYAVAGSAVRWPDGRLELFYSRDTTQALRRATSADDGRIWVLEPLEDLTPQTFGCRRLGLPYVQRTPTVTWLLCEGIDDRGRSALYAAWAHKGAARMAAGAWVPHTATPLYTPAPEAWDRAGQANPSLGPFGVLVYNGCAAPGDWDLGYLLPDPTTGGWRAHPPLLRRDAGEARLEGGRLVATPDGLRLLFFSLPTADSFAGGTIRVAHVEVG